MQVQYDYSDRYNHSSTEGEVSANQLSHKSKTSILLSTELK